MGVKIKFHFIHKNQKKNQITSQQNKLHCSAMLLYKDYVPEPTIKLEKGPEPNRILEWDLKGKGNSMLLYNDYGPEPTIKLEGGPQSY